MRFLQRFFANRSANRTAISICVAFAMAAIFLHCGSSDAAAAVKPASLWVMAYYPQWQEQYLPPDKIDFTAFSHIVQFAVIPRPDGSLDTIPGRTISLADSQALITRAHAANRKVLISVGGDKTLDVMRAAISDPVRPIFIENLVHLVTSRGYDGVDVDMEPLQDQDVPNYEKFVRALRARMNQANPKLQMTAAVVWEPAAFARLKDCFDRINLMTYDMSGPWQGFSTWHNSPLASPAGEMMAGGIPYPSIKSWVAKFVQAGVPPSKISIGIAFYGYAWTGVSGPRQSAQGTAVTQPAYSEIMDREYPAAQRKWDPVAQVPYLSIDAPLPANRLFVSYDNAQSCAAKFQYARQAGLGGIIIWELGDGYRADQPPGQRDQLLQAVKKAWKTPVTQGHTRLASAAEKIVKP